jgi:Calcineurin-like phosphoesterase
MKYYIDRILLLVSSFPLSRSAVVFIFLMSIHISCNPHSSDPAVQFPFRMQPKTIIGPNKLPAQYPSAGKLDAVRQPYLLQNSFGAITVMWENTEECLGLVEFWDSGSFQLARQDGIGRRHKITLTEIPAATTEMTYRVRCIAPGDMEFSGNPRKAYLSTPRTFHTRPGAEQSYRFAVYGDSRSNPPVHKNLADRMAAFRPNFVANTGDVVTDGRIYEQWDKDFFEPAARLFGLSPLIVSIGNHENNAQYFHALLDRPSPISYFSFSYGNSFNIVIDSIDEQSLSPGGTQIAWLEKTLRSPGRRVADWLFIYSHYPLDTEAKPFFMLDPAIREYVEPLVTREKADIVFCGHAHVYERGELHGVQWITTGGGGAKLNRRWHDVEFITVSHRRHHFIMVDVDKRELRLVAYDIEGKKIDSLLLKK